MKATASPATKVCRRCGQEKPTSDYMKASREKDGLDKWCRPCCADYQREWREKKAAQAAGTAEATAQGAPTAPTAAQAPRSAPAPRPYTPRVLPPDHVPDTVEEVSTDEGQRLLAQAAAAAAEARRAAWAEAKRQQRARAKAAQEAQA